MLDQNDLKILAEMFSASEARMMKRMERIEERMERIEKRMDAQEEQQKKMEADIYDELGRVQSYLERKIDSVQNDVSEMKKYYRIERVENTTSAAILKIVSNLQKDVEELKRKIA